MREMPCVEGLTGCSLCERTEGVCWRWRLQRKLSDPPVPAPALIPAPSQPLSPLHLLLSLPGNFNYLSAVRVTAFQERTTNSQTVFKGTQIFLSSTCARKKFIFFKEQTQDLGNWNSCPLWSPRQKLVQKKYIKGCISYFCLSSETTCQPYNLCFHVTSTLNYTQEKNGLCRSLLL